MISRERDVAVMFKETITAVTIIIITLAIITPRKENHNSSRRSKGKYACQLVCSSNSIARTMKMIAIMLNHPQRI